MPANATNPDELPSQPRKPLWKLWALAFACVVAIALAVLFFKAPLGEPVSIRFVGITNYHGQDRLVFKGTNSLPNAIRYDAWAFRSTNAVAPTDLATIFASSAKVVTVGAREAFTFALDAPAQSPNWRMRWTYYAAPHPLTRWEQTKLRCYLFMSRHHLRTVAGLFGTRLRINYISPSDLKD